MDFDEFRLAAALSDLAHEPLAREHADCVEFRMDLADEPLEELAAYDGDLPLLATNRAEWEGGKASADDRIDALVTAAELERVEAIDVELRSLERGEGDSLLDIADEHDTAVIVSSHDFDGTPDAAEMHETLVEACKWGDVGKLAVTANGPGDVLEVLSVTYELTESGARVATMAMGAAGRHSRAVTPIYGSKIGYAPVDPAKATAPGQYDLETLATLVSQLR